MKAPRVSLDQWAALVAVVDAGGYARAAERLHKSQSTLTYAVQSLEERLGVSVFVREGRRARLTPTGELLYRRGKALLADAERLEHVAGELASGWEPEIRLAAEITYPTWLLLECLHAFGAERPDIRIELHETVLGGNEEALAGGSVHLAIGPVPSGFAGTALMPVRFRCLASPDHPLHRLGRPLTLEDLRPHRHLLVRDSGVLRTRAGGSFQNERRWTVSHKATSIRAAVMGLGYAWYPEEVVRDELARGALKPLPLVEGAERFSTLYLVFADRDAAGPGTRRLAQIILDRTAEACAREGDAPAGKRTRTARPAAAR